MLIHLAEATRRQFGAYAYLRDHDLTSESETSRRLRQSDQHFGSRIADELRELAGVLDGEHRHAGREPDVLLEASQVIYWLLLESLRNGVTWMTLRPDRALATVDDAAAGNDGWPAASRGGGPLVRRCRQLPGHRRGCPCDLVARRAGLRQRRARSACRRPGRSGRAGIPTLSRSVFRAQDPLERDRGGRQIT